MAVTSRGGIWLQFTGMNVMQQVFPSQIKSIRAAVKPKTREQHSTGQYQGPQDNIRVHRTTPRSMMYQRPLGTGLHVLFTLKMRKKQNKTMQNKKIYLSAERH